MAGDTLWAIAQRYGLTVDELLAANPQITDRSIIRVGDRIVIPLDAQKARVWDLGRDVGATSNQISFDQGANGVWYFMQSAGLDQDATSYSLLPAFTTPCGKYGVAGLLCWVPRVPYTYEDGYPWIGYNAATTPRIPKPPAIWPARTVLMHPAPDKLAIVAWKSPVGGSIDIEGSFADIEACGNGVAWSIDIGGRTLDDGIIPDGVGNKGVFHLSRVRISHDEVVYFIVDPRERDYYCDGTTLLLTIRTD